MKNLDVASARDILISLLEAGFTSSEEVQRYADWRLSQSEQLSDDDLIILAEASTATDEEALLGAFFRTRRRDGRPTRNGCCGWRDAHIGLEFLKFEGEQLDLAQLLNHLGRYIDQRGHPRFDCEDFFELLTKLEFGTPRREVEEEFNNLVKDSVDCARRELKLVGFTNNGEFAPNLWSR